MFKEHLQTSSQGFVENIHSTILHSCHSSAADCTVAIYLDVPKALAMGIKLFRSSNDVAPRQPNKKCPCTKAHARLHPFEVEPGDSDSDRFIIISFISLNGGRCCKIISCNLDLVVFVPFLFSSNGDCRSLHGAVPRCWAAATSVATSPPSSSPKPLRSKRDVCFGAFAAGGDGTIWDHHPIPKEKHGTVWSQFRWFHHVSSTIWDGFCVEYLGITMIYIDLENYTFSNARWDWMFKNFWHLIACFCLALSTFLKQKWRLNQLSNLDMTSMFGWWFQCMYCSFISEKNDQHWLIFVQWVCHHMPPTSHDQRLICVRWYMLFI